MSEGWGSPSFLSFSSFLSFDLWSASEASRGGVTGMTKITKMTGVTELEKKRARCAAKTQNESAQFVTGRAYLEHLAKPRPTPTSLRDRLGTAHGPRCAMSLVGRVPMIAATRGRNARRTATGLRRRRYYGKGVDDYLKF